MAANLTASQLTYDIPEDADIPNPSAELRQYGVRQQLSVWIIPNAYIPWGLIARLREAGSTVDVIPFDASAMPTILSVVRRSLLAQIRQAVESARLSAQAATDKADDIDPTQEDARKIILRRINQARAALREADRLLADYEQAAKRFGMDPNGLNFTESHWALRSIRSGTENRADAILRAAERARAYGSEGDALANAMLADAAHPGILLDYLEEREEDVTAEREILMRD